MALMDIVKGICAKSRCKYNVYTKEKTDELLSEKANDSEVYKKTETYTKEEVTTFVNGKIATIKGTLTGTGIASISDANLTYPEGFTKDNCTVIAVMVGNATRNDVTTGPMGTQNQLIQGALNRNVLLKDDGLTIYLTTVPIGDAQQTISSDYTYNYTIVLMKIV